jgi:hypothetical protein
MKKMRAKKMQRGGAPEDVLIIFGGSYNQELIYTINEMYIATNEGVRKLMFEITNEVNYKDADEVINYPDTKQSSPQELTQFIATLLAPEKILGAVYTRVELNSKNIVKVCTESMGKIFSEENKEIVYANQYGLIEGNQLFYAYDMAPQTIVIDGTTFYVRTPNDLDLNPNNWHREEFEIQLSNSLPTAHPVLAPHIYNERRFVGVNFPEFFDESYRPTVVKVFSEYETPEYHITQSGIVCYSLKIINDNQIVDDPNFEITPCYAIKYKLKILGSSPSTMSFLPPNSIERDNYQNWKTMYAYKNPSTPFTSGFSLAAPIQHILSPIINKMYENTAMEPIPTEPTEYIFSENVLDKKIMIDELTNLHILKDIFGIEIISFTIYTITDKDGNRIEHVFNAPRMKYKYQTRK